MHYFNTSFVVEVGGGSYVAFSRVAVPSSENKLYTAAAVEGV